MINAFKQVRLTNNLISGINGRISVGGTNTLMTTDSGNFINLTNFNTYSGSLQSYITATGAALINLINSSAAGVQNLNGVSGQITLSGAAGNLISISGQTIYISGNTGYLSSYYPVTNPNQFASSGNLTTTGSALQAAINTLSGNLSLTGTTLINLSGQFNITGSNLQNAINTLSGNLALTGATLVNLSGQFNITGANLYSYINVYSGNQQNFITGILPTGNDTYFIQFPLNFPSPPKVQTTVEIGTGSNIMYGVNIQNRTVSGFFALFSDIIQESGVNLHVIATIN